VHPLVRLEHVVEEEATVAAGEPRRPWLPRRSSPRELLTAHAERELPLRHVELDLVAVADERQRPADRRLGRDVEDHGAVPSTAPSGHRFPERMTVPPSGESGIPSGRMTSSFQHLASRALSAMDLPFTVGASPWSSGRSSLRTAGRPPA